MLPAGSACLRRSSSLLTWIRWTLPSNPHAKIRSVWIQYSCPWHRLDFYHLAPVPSFHPSACLVIPRHRSHQKQLYQSAYLPHDRFRGVSPHQLRFQNHVHRLHPAHLQPPRCLACLSCQDLATKVCALPLSLCLAVRNMVYGSSITATLWMHWIQH